MHSHKARPLLIEITVRSHDRIRGRCSQCQRSAPGYDRLPERRWRFVPLWGIPTSFLYPPRRVECTEHGVVVEHIPWSHGKRPVTCAMIDRKSTRLNSSHGYISYAVFCLKKKKRKCDR